MIDGIIYILEIKPKFWHAQYYVGWCNPRGLWNRLKQHRTGHGAKITQAAVKAGHRLVLVAELPGTRDDERAIKNRKNTPKFVEQLRRHGLLNGQQPGTKKCDTPNPLPSPTELIYIDEEEDIMGNIDLSHVDLVALIEKDSGQKLKKEAKCHVGLCPFCNQGRDRFVVWPHKWWCRRCDKGGDAINYLMYRHGVTFQEACKELGVTLPGSRPSSRTIAPTLKRQEQPTDNIKISPERESPAFADPAWTEGAMMFAKECQTRLLTSAPEAVRYLVNRGLTMDTIEDAMIGYNHKDRTVKWGETNVFAPEGLVFPWEDRFDGLRRINFRPNNGPHKYRLAEGSAQALYMGDRVRLNARVIMVEGEIDALTIWQAYRRSSWICPVATGSVTHGRVARLIARLALAKSIQVAFDGDEAGQAAVRWWASISSKITVLPAPFPHKDVNALYCAALSDPEGDGKRSFADAAVSAWIEGDAL